MKTILITSIAISVCWYTYHSRSEIKRFNELKKVIHENILLKKESCLNRSILHDLVTIPTDETIKENELIIKHFKK